MLTPADQRAAGEQAVSTKPNRRRHPRYAVQAPATMRCAAGLVEGCSVNLSYSGVLVKSPGALPEVGEECEITIHFPIGEVKARGKVVRVDRARNSCAVDLAHLDEGGDLLLVVLVMAGGSPV
jgi:hypothetical protein